MKYIDYTTFMQEAIKEAHCALDINEVPIGAVVVNQQGTIIGRGFNKVEVRKTQSAHAEFEAIDQACKVLDNWRLDGCTLVVTLEPCAMCMNFIIVSRISYLVYGASSPVFGWHNHQEALLYLYRLNKVNITTGISSEEIQRLMKNFFVTKRNSYDSVKK